MQPGERGMKRRTFYGVFAGTLALAGAARAEPEPRFRLSSPDYADNAVLARESGGGGRTPDVAACGGDNLSPALTWSDAPANTKSFAILMYDPEGAAGRGVVHLVAYGIPASVTSMRKGALSSPSKGFVGGSNVRGMPVYFGPCPPPTDDYHHYAMTIIALDLPAGALPPGLSRQELLDHTAGHGLGSAGMVVRYRR